MNGHLQQSRLRKLWKDYGNIIYCIPVILGILITYMYACFGAYIMFFTKIFI